MKNQRGLFQKNQKNNCVYIRSVLILVVALFTFSVHFKQLSFAEKLNSVSINLSRINESTPAVHTIRFVSTSGVAATQNIIVSLPVGFNIGSSFDFSDVDLAEGDSSNCDTASWTSKTIAASPSGTIWGFTVSGQDLIFTSGTDTITANRCVRIIFFDNGVNNQITNPAVVSDQVFNFDITSGTGVDNGQGAVIILDDPSIPDGDQVSLSANVVTTLILDLDTTPNNCINNTETSISSVNLGVLYPGNVNFSGSNINFICIDTGTNAGNGVAVFVRSSRVNSIGGLVNGGSVIASASANLNLNANPSGYGLRVSSVGTPQFGTIVSTVPFNSATPGDVGAIPGSLAAPAKLFGSSGATRTGVSDRVAIEVSAKASNITDGGNYSDILTFTAFVNL
jgi:hypothetical protein